MIRQLFKYASFTSKYDPDLEYSRKIYDTYRKYHPSLDKIDLDLLLKVFDPQQAGEAVNEIVQRSSRAEPIYPAARIEIIQQYEGVGDQSMQLRIHHEENSGFLEIEYRPDSGLLGLRIDYDDEPRFDGAIRSLLKVMFLENGSLHPGWREIFWDQDEEEA